MWPRTAPAGERVTPALESQRQQQVWIIAALPALLTNASDEVVELLETHLSWLFFTETEVLKLKKPLRYEQLDYSSPGIRHRLCRAEVRLNRRLSAQTYLGVRAVTRDGSGRLALDGAGEALEHLVAMRRIPADRNLEILLARDAIGARKLDALTVALVRFHAARRGLRIDPRRHLRQLENLVEQDIHALGESRYGLDRGLIRRLARTLPKALEDRGVEVAERIRAGRIVEGHGDLRPEHVYFNPEPIVIDCLEFSFMLRILDVMDEIAFFAMECDRLDAPWVGERVVLRYRILARDDASDLLLHWYKARRALLWAKLAVWHLAREPQRERDRWLSRAEHYLALARIY